MRLAISLATTAEDTPSKKCRSALFEDALVLIRDSVIWVVDRRPMRRTTYTSLRRVGYSDDCWQDC